MKILAFTKTYEKRRVLDFPGMQLEKGRVYCIIGANGSGKSTFARVLSGTITPDAAVRPAAGISVGHLPQRSYAFRMSTRANIMLAGKDESRADELMRALHISHLANERADRLSGGETARMAIARLMMRRYDLVILDEPTAAMDVETTILTEDEILRYVRDTGCALVLITHSLRQARRLADEVLFFHEGQLVEAGGHVLSQPQQARTRQFLEFYGV